MQSAQQLVSTRIAAAVSPPHHAEGVSSTRRGEGLGVGVKSGGRGEWLALLPLSKFSFPSRVHPTPILSPSRGGESRRASVTVCDLLKRRERRVEGAVARDVKRAMHKRKRGTLKSGRSGKTVKSRKQAIAIGLSEARKKGKKVPKRKSG